MGACGFDGRGAWSEAVIVFASVRAVVTSRTTVSPGGFDGGDAWSEAVIVFALVSAVVTSRTIVSPGGGVNSAISEAPEDFASRSLRAPRV